MSNILFSWENAIDAATLEATSEGGLLKAYNLARPELKRVWRSLATTASFNAIFSAATSMKLLALAGVNFASSDQIRHRLYDASDVNILDVTVDADLVDGVHAYLLDNALAVKRWNCEITATSRAALGTFDVGRAWASPVFSPTINISYGWGSGLIGPASSRRARYSGTMFPRSAPKFKVVEFALEFMSQADRDTIREMVQAIEDHSQVLCLPTGELPDPDIILGHFADLEISRQNIPALPALYSQSFRIEQDL